MKTLLSILTLLFLSQIMYGQTKIDSIITENKEFRKSNLSDAIRFGESKSVFKEYDMVIFDFEEMKTNLLSIDDLSNKEVQKAIMQPFADKYYNYFNFGAEGKKENVLSYGYTKKEDLTNKLKIAEAVMLVNIVDKEMAVIGNARKQINDYINSNLKRLKIPRATFDKMSSNDKDLLWKTFK